MFILQHFCLKIRKCYSQSLLMFYETYLIDSNIILYNSFFKKDSSLGEGICVPQHVYEGQRTVFVGGFSFSTVESGNRTQIVRFAQQVLLRTKPSFFKVSILRENFSFFFFLKIILFFIYVYVSVICVLDQRKKENLGPLELELPAVVSHEYVY